MIYIEREWEFRKTIMRDKKSTAEIAAKLVKQSYCPGKFLRCMTIEFITHIF